MMKWIVRLIVGLVVGLGGACAPYLLLQHATRQATQYKIELDEARQDRDQLRAAVQDQNRAIQGLRAEGIATAARLKVEVKKGQQAMQQAQQEAQGIEAAQVPADDPEAASWGAQEAQRLAEGWR